MIKLDLQKELLEKIKPGIKPRDLKKPNKNSQGIPTPPPSPIIVPLDKKISQKQGPKSILTSPIVQDEGYESDSSIISNEQPLKSNQKENQQIKQLQQEVNYWVTTASNYLTNLQRIMAELDQTQEEIKDLKKKKPETLNQAAEQALMEANQKLRTQAEIIQNLQEKNEKLTKTMQYLQNQVKTPKEIKPEPIKEPKLYLFTCSICDQNKRSQLHLGKVNGLGIDPRKENKICDACIRKVDLIQEKESFF